MKCPPNAEPMIGGRLAGWLGVWHEDVGVGLDRLTACQLPLLVEANRRILGGIHERVTEVTQWLPSPHFLGSLLECLTRSVEVLATGELFGLRDDSIADLTLDVQQDCRSQQFVLMGLDGIEHDPGQSVPGGIVNMTDIVRTSDSLVDRLYRSHEETFFRVDSPCFYTIMSIYRYSMISI